LRPCRTVLLRYFMTDTKEFVVAPEDSGRRLDSFLVRHLPDWSRSQLQRLIRSRRVEIGSRVIEKAGESVRAGDCVRVSLERKPEPRAVAEALPMDVVYEDDDLVVVNKPAGMVVHLGAGITSGTVVNALLFHIRQLSAAGGDERPGIVHRLDKMTSGLMIVAKNDFAHRKLAADFKARAVQKTYTALVHGRLTEDVGVIDSPIGRDPRRRLRMKTGGLRAREAQSSYKALRRFAHFTLLQVFPHTGRTHQIRAHLSSIGHPVVGDTLYGAPARIRVHGREKNTLPRTFLHASALSFKHPRTGNLISLEAPLPEELQNFLDLISDL
jgi:23S rRNA pseudouridine1911/1915/1917 synthase